MVYNKNRQLSIINLIDLSGMNGGSAFCVFIGLVLITAACTAKDDTFNQNEHWLWLGIFMVAIPLSCLLCQKLKENTGQEVLMEKEREIAAQELATIV